MSIQRSFIFFLLLSLLGCSAHEDFQPPDNPFDPGNPDYVSPRVQIIEGPQEGEVVASTEVTFVWEGNETATEYTYQFDGSDWSAWTVNTSAVFDYLDEGEHVFAVKTRSINGDAQAIPAELAFSVDAVAGPSALVYPYRQSGSPGDTLIYQIMAEEVTDLFAVECNITFNAEYVELLEVVIGDILNEWGGTPLLIPEVSASSLSISMVAVEGSSSFSGTTSLMTLSLRIKPTANIGSGFTVIEIPGSTYLNPDLETIDVASNREGMLDVR